MKVPTQHKFILKNIHTIKLGKQVRQKKGLLVSATLIIWPFVH
ncbi:hypothetical protein M153_2100027478 [Pseudoloma neurophilia]|uniref:Uncharacterized protein n=1 Tax=Pseudoloma neurophilia TaxID=146866 RepID=A0A0R0M871_9MICR|nr:hypothetical protein M153_2100027478 [Pseudoloma neurophilia]